MNLEQHLKLLQQLEHENGTPSRQDREIGKRFSHLKHKPEAQLEMWLNETSVGSQTNESGLAKSMLAVSTGLFLIGTLIGIGAAAGVLYYDGSAPINIITAFLALVVLPGLLLLFWWLAALPPRLTQWLAGMSSCQNLIATVNPGQFAQRLLRRSSTFQKWFDAGDSDSTLTQYLRSVSAAQSLFWSQLFGVGFAVGALVGTLYLVAFTDLAFGWSTTLPISSESVAFAVNAVASPWQSLWPAAAPDSSLIEATRFFRLRDSAANISDASVPGLWWPFLVMCLLVYVLLLRALTLYYANSRSKRVASNTLLSLPLIQSLLLRMNQPLIQTRASIEKELANLSESNREIETLTPQQTGNCYAINWAATLPSSEGLLAFLQQTFAISVDRTYEAGGANSIEQDTNVIQHIAQSPSSTHSIILAVKSWEPPLLEILDFLQNLRNVLARKQSIIVLPFNQNGRLADAKTDAENLSVWNSVVARLEAENVFVALLVQPS